MHDLVGSVLDTVEHASISQISAKWIWILPLADLAMREHL